MDIQVEAEVVQEKYEDELDSKIGIERVIEPLEDVKEVRIYEVDPTKIIKVGRNLHLSVKEKIVNTVRANQNVLAWSHFDMKGINSNTIFQALNIKEDAKPIRQKWRPLDSVRAKAVKANVDKLTANDFLQVSLNARATYQRLVNKMFKNQLRRNMEVYVDDMLVPPTGDNPTNLAWPPKAVPSTMTRLNTLINAMQDPTGGGQVSTNIGQPAQSTMGVPLTKPTPRLREVVGQVQGHTNILHHEQEETPAVVSDAFTQYRCKFQEWMDWQAVILQAHQAELNRWNREANELIKLFNEWVGF
uniref:Reverse transcriptase domain-containing protein n=1 Tax=Cannabis sativa TaxID=3483 RepID=A0A803NWG5_CANSA